MQTEHAQPVKTVITVPATMRGRHVQTLGPDTLHPMVRAAAVPVVISRVRSLAPSSRYRRARTACPMDHHQHLGPSIMVRLARPANPHAV